MTTEPVRTVMIPIALLAFAAAAQAFVDGADVRGVVTAVLGVLVVAAQELARGKVTPTAVSGGRWKDHVRDERGVSDALVLGIIAGLALAAVLFVLL